MVARRDRIGRRPTPAQTETEGGDGRATYAVEGSMQAGIWGVSSQNREWLQRLNPTLAVALIDEARTKAVPVEVHIRAARLR